MYDSITAANIPTTAAVVAGYVDGKYKWSDVDWAHFPHSVKVRIAVFAATNDGHVLDVESGDATPAQAVGWVQRRRAAGFTPTVYCNHSTWTATNGVQAAFKAAGVLEPQYWIAEYDTPMNGTIYPGAIGHQYVDQGPYDLSNVLDVWPGVDPDVTSTVPTQAADAVPPVTISDPTHRQIEGLLVAKIAISMPTDGDGNGWIDVPLPAGADHTDVMCIIWDANEPTAVGYVDNDNSDLAFDKPCRIILRGARPNTPIVSGRVYVLEGIQTGAVGPQGVEGPQGAQGAPGIPGLNGSNGDVSAEPFARALAAKLAVAVQ